MFSFICKSRYMIVLVILILSLSVSGVFQVLAQEKYPDSSRSIDLIIPFAPGGVTDIAGRIFADELAKLLRVPVTPLNKPGASGTHGATLVFKAPKDGYSLLANTISGMVLAPVILPNVEFDTLKDFFPIAIISNIPNTIVVKSDSPYKDINALIEAAKKNPGKISYGTAGVGTDGNFNGEILGVTTGVKFKHIPFKGGGEVAPAVMGGHVDFGVGASTTFVPLDKGGKLKMVAITGDVRMKAVPDTPTFHELGIKGDFIDNWAGFFASSKTPKHILDTLVAATEKVLKNKDFVERIEKTGGIVQYMTPSEFKAIIERNKKTATEISKKVGMAQQK